MCEWALKRQLIGLAAKFIANVDDQTFGLEIQCVFFLPQTALKLFSLGRYINKKKRGMLNRHRHFP